jgi:hypothetical protein
LLVVEDCPHALSACLADRLTCSRWDAWNTVHQWLQLCDRAENQGWAVSPAQILVKCLSPLALVLDPCILGSEYDSRSCVVADAAQFSSRYLDKTRELWRGATRNRLTRVAHLWKHLRSCQRWSLRRSRAPTVGNCTRKHLVACHLSRCVVIASAYRVIAVLGNVVTSAVTVRSLGILRWMMICWMKHKVAWCVHHRIPV